MNKTNEILSSDERSKILEQALLEAAKDARRKHKQAGNPIVVWRGGKAVWIPANEIPEED